MTPANAAGSSGEERESLIDNPRFRRFWSADLAIRVTGRAWGFALPVIAIDYLSADARQVGYLAAAASASYLIVGLPAGVWIDRTSKRRVMLYSSVSRFILVAAVASLWLLGSLSLSHMYCAALLIGVASLFYDIADQSYIPEIVPDRKTQLANSLLETTSRSVNAVGPTLFGLFVKLLTAPALLVGVVIGYIVSVLLLFKLPEGESVAVGGEDRSLVKELLEAFRAIAQEPALLRIAIAVSLSGAFAVVITTLVPLLVLDELQLGTVYLGLILSSAELGGLAGAIALTFAHRRFGIGTILSASLVVAALFTALVPLSVHVATQSKPFAVGLLMTSLFGTAFGGVMFAVSQISLRQQLCPKHLIGRVNASMRFVVWGGVPIASVAAGWCAHTFGVSTTLWLSVFGTVLTMLPILGISRLIPRPDR